MSDQPASKKFSELVSGYLHGQLSPEDAARLESFLRDSAEHRDRFVREAYIYHQAGELIRGDAHADLMESVDPADLELISEDTDDGSDVMAFVIDQALAERRKHELEDEANRQLAAQLAEDARNRWYELRRQAEAEPVKRVIVIPKALVWLGLAATMGLVATIAIYVNSSSTNTITPPADSIAQTPGGEEEGMPVTTSVAIVRSSFEARWSGDSYGDADYLPSNHSVTLTEGLAEIVFGNGTTVLVEGPATFEPTGPNAMRLIAGQITATPTDASHGFTISTPSARVTEYGAEFGLIVNTDGQTLAQAFAGRVGLTPHRGTEEVRLLAGDAVVSNTAGRVREVQPDVLAFVRQDEFVAQRDAATSAYARWLAYSYELRRDADVMAYFAPDRETTRLGVLSNLASGTTNDATVEGPSLVAGRFTQKPALGFDSQREFCSFTDNTRIKDLTLAAWVWIDQLGSSHVMLIGSDFYETPGATCWQLEVAEDGRTWGISLGMLTTPNQKWTSWGILSPSDAGRWVHLAVVADAAAGQTRFYVDGAVREVQAYHPTSPLVFGNARIGNYRNEGRGSTPWDRHLDGRIDEMVILSRPMSNEEIQQMFDAGKPPRRR